VAAVSSGENRRSIVEARSTQLETLRFLFLSIVEVQSLVFYANGLIYGGQPQHR